jgi:glycosyltransferase involved in cell wall biosynthesis
MKICLYTETALPQLGGQELVVDALARQYQAQGHQVAVLAPYPRHRFKLTPDDSHLPYATVRHIRFWSTWRKLRWYRYWLLRLHRSFPFDVLHCQSVYPCGYLGALCKENLDFALVITSHGGCLEPASTYRQKPGAMQRYALAAERADMLVSISRFTRDAMREFAPSAPITDIPNGVDCAEYEVPHERPPQLAPAIQTGQYVLFMGRLHARKGVDLLLDAWARIAARRKTPCALVVAGDGEERRPLAEQAQRLGIAADVHFVGAAGGATKAWLLQNTRFVCIPSRDWEAFPLVVLEAFAAGKPVLGTRVPGLDSLLEPGTPGWLSPPESPADLAAGLETALSLAPEEARRLSDSAKRIAREHSWDKVAARYLEVFEQLLRQRHP